MEYLNIIIAAVFVNNVLLTDILGIDSAVSASNSTESAISIGLSTTLVTVISAILSKLVYDLLLINEEFTVFTTFVFVVIAAVVVVIFNSLLKKSSNTQQESLEQFVPMITVNSLILGVALLAVERSLTVLQTLIYSIGVGLGFTLTLILVSAINHKYRYSNMPRQYREKATTFLALGLMALAFYGFKGLV